MKRLIRSAILLSTLLLTGSCGRHGTRSNTPLMGNTDKANTVVFAKVGLSASIVFEPDPPVVEEESAFQLRFWQTGKGDRVKGPFIDPGYAIVHPYVRLWMPDHGHGSSPLKPVKKVEGKNTVFQMNNAVFTMIGKWQIQFKLRKPKNPQTGAESPVEDTGVIEYVQK